MSEQTTVVAATRLNEASIRELSRMTAQTGSVSYICQRRTEQHTEASMLHVYITLLFVWPTPSDLEITNEDR
jgi:hypothetical protein